MEDGNSMENCSDWSKFASQSSVTQERNYKLKLRELLFPENLSIEVLKINLINRSIIKENTCKSKEELVELFRQHVSPRPRRDSDSSLLNAVQAVSLKSSCDKRTEFPYRYAV